MDLPVLVRQYLSMKHLSLCLLLIGCSQLPSKNRENLVSLDAALNQAQASYLKGCVIALKDLRIPAAFSSCRDKAMLHRQELDLMLGQEIDDEMN